MPFQIEIAQVSDLQDIANLHNALVLKRNKTQSVRGFFLMDTSEEALASRLGRNDCLFLVAKFQGLLASYLIASKSAEHLDRLSWLVPDAKYLLDGRYHWHVDQIATAAPFLGKNYASTLYSELAKHNQNGPISAYVATAPFNNEVSLKFHLRLGFQKVAVFESSSFLGIPHYKSVLLLKNQAHNHET